MIDIKKVEQEAAKELLEEAMGEAKKRVKKLLKEIATSKIVTGNLERELKDLYVTLGQNS